MPITPRVDSNMSPRLLKVMERAKRDPQVRFTSLAHLIDEEALERAFGRLRKEAAVGVDGITKEQYGRELPGCLGTQSQRSARPLAIHNR